MTALWYLGAGFVLGWLSLAIISLSRDIRPRRNRLQLPGDRTWRGR
jgi:hypothetical protein